MQKIVPPVMPAPVPPAPVPLAAPQPAPAPAPDVKPVPVVQAPETTPPPPPQPQAKEPSSPPSAPQPAPVPVPATTQPTNNLPDSRITIAPVLREIEEQKPPLKTEPRNGLDTSHYIDPIERSLASLERSLKAEVPMDDNVGVSESSMRLEEEFSMPKQQMMPDAAHQTLMAQLGGLAEITRLPDQIKNEMYLPPHNGYGEQNMKHEREMLRPDMIPNIPGLTNIQPMSSIFDPVPAIPHSVIAQSHHSMPSAPCIITPPIKKEENKPLLTPKPIEDLMGVSNMQQNNMSDRAKYEMEKKISEETKNSNFAAAFKLKQEQNLKNASSWSSLAQAGSPQSIPSVAPSTAQVKQKPVMDSFQVSNPPFIMLVFS